LEDPERFASELFKAYGMEALKYYVVVVKYADSGKYNPEEESEEQAEAEELESIVRETESTSESDGGTGPSG
jgi:hypothetical protein